MGRHFSLSALFLAFCVLSSGLAAATKPNLILITLDSGRADRMGFLGSHHGLTPNLDAVAKESVIFERAYTQAPLTVESVATILTGTYPQTHHANSLSVPLAVGLPYFPDLLHGSGYHTAAFVGSVLLDPQNGPFQAYGRGFDTYDAGFVEGKSLRPGIQVVERADKWLTGQNRSPFFLWIHLQDADISRVSYDREIRMADAAVGKLISTLRAQKLYDDSLIVVAADHGQALGDHGEETHGLFLYDETVRVPLLMKLPQNKSAGKRVANRARLLDVAPAILEIAGVPTPSQMQGQSLLRIAQGSSQTEQPSYARTDLPQQGFACGSVESWRAGKFLYVRAPKPELYDLATDPGATHNLEQTSKATLETLASQLQSFDTRIAKEGGTASPGLTSSQVQLLASLGYVGVAKNTAGVQTGTTGTDPKDIVAIANKTLMAMALVESGQSARAVLAFRPIISERADTYLAQYGLGAALVREQKYSDAIPYLHKAIELQPESAWAQYEMGLCLVKTGQFKTAALHLEIAENHLPAFSPLHSALADAYSHLGRKDNAARERKLAEQ